MWRSGSRRKLITIPVVVHVVYKTDEENISDEQIQSQIDVLNKDYRATNPDRDDVPDPWTGLAADPNIQFALATKDPDGKATNGITRTQTTRDSFGTDDAREAERPAAASPPWPADRTSTSGSATSAAACSATRSSPAARRRPTAS